MTGLYTNSEVFWDRWVTELRSTRLHRSTGKERDDLEVKEWSCKKPILTSYFDNGFHFDPHELWTIKFTLLDNSHTQDGQMVLLNLMVL